MTLFYLVRHAHTDAVGHTLAGRATGYGLNQRGWEEAARLAGMFRDLHVPCICVSPRLRARETAGAIAAVTGAPVRDEAGLDEIDFGAWTGLSFHDLQGQPQWQGWNAFRSLEGTPGGETMLQVQARAVDVLQRLHAEGGAYVLVSHADVVRAILAYALGTPLDLMQRITVDPASLSVVELLDRDLRVTLVNRTA